MKKIDFILWNLFCHASVWQFWLKKDQHFETWISLKLFSARLGFEVLFCRYPVQCDIHLDSYHRDILYSRNYSHHRPSYIVWHWGHNLRIIHLYLTLWCKAMQSIFNDCRNTFTFCVNKGVELDWWFCIDAAHQYTYSQSHHTNQFNIHFGPVKINDTFSKNKIWCCLATSLVKYNAQHILAGFYSQDRTLEATVIKMNFN